MLKQLFYFFYPRHCFVCQTDIENEVLCDACYMSAERKAHYCNDCGCDLLPNVECLICENEDRKILIDHHIIGYEYNDIMRQAIIQLKFQHKTYMVEVIKKLMKPILQDHSNILSKVDYIVPMPVDRVRLAGRGFNHMLEISQGLQPLIERPIVHNILKKRAFSIPQSNLSKAERAKNLEEAFLSMPLKGHILLLDDVLTTGKTLQNAAQSLKEAGVTEITALILAKA